MNDKFSLLHEIISHKAPNVCEVTVIKDGNVVYENFWHGFKKGDALNVMSVTKSIISLLIGIAIDKGFIGNVYQKVLEFFPDYVPKRGEKTIQEVTIRHLLTMTAPYKYRSEPWTKVCTSDDWTRAALDLLGGRSGITGEFKYTTLGIQIMSGIIEHSTKMKLIDFANEYLFSTLDIPKHMIHLASTKEDYFDYIMDKGPRKNEWFSDPTGSVTAGWGLTLSATDMAKIGYLLLKKGEYQKKRVVSAEWINEMTMPYVDLDKKYGNMSYGYLWWITDKDKNTFSAIGDGGNVIYVNPELNVAVGVAGTLKPRIFDRVEFIEREILPLLI